MTASASASAASSATRMAAARDGRAAAVRAGSRTKCATTANASVSAASSATKMAAASPVTPDPAEECPQKELAVDRQALRRAADEKNRAKERSTPRRTAKAIETPRCPTGFTGTRPNCKPVDKPKCPRGTVGTPPNCKPIPNGLSARPWSGHHPTVGPS